MAKKNKLNVKELKRFAEDCRQRSLRHDDTAMVTFVHYSPINSSGDRLMEQIKHPLTYLIADNPNGFAQSIVGIETEVTATLFIHDIKLETSIMSYLTRYSCLIEEETRYDKMIDHARGICLLADYYSEWREESEDDPEHYWTMYWHDIFLAFSMNVQSLLDEDCQGGMSPGKPAKPVEKIGGWTKKEIVEHVKDKMCSWSSSSFVNVRKKSTVVASESSGKGQQRRYSDDEIEELALTVGDKKNNFRNGIKIALALRELLSV